MMARLPAFSTKKLIAALRKRGFLISTRGGKGSHIKIIHPQTGISLTIPHQKELKPGLRARIIKNLIQDFRLSKNDLLKDL